MRKRKGTLPEELIEEILLRLPVRSLVRFKCVSKYWHSLISDVRFAKSHFDLAAAPTHRLLLKLLARYEAEAVDEDDSAGVFFNIPDPSLAPPCPACDVLVAGSCRGFLLLTTEFAVSDFIYFLIWNPCTGFQKRFNKQFNRYDERFNPRVLYGIGYDPSTDDYLVVTVTLRMEVHCFSSRTNSWSSCTNGQGIVPYRHMGHSFAHGAFLNGALHWLVRSPHDLTLLIIAFDVIERRLSEIPLSHDLAVAMKGKQCYLRVMEGCLSVSLSGYQVWTMKEYKVQSSWTKTLVVSHNYCFYPICISKNGETFGCNAAAQTLARVNDKCELLELRTHARCKGGYDIPHCVMYRESLLSLPGDFEKPSEDQSLEELI